MRLQPTSSKGDLLAACGYPFAEGTRLEPSTAGPKAAYGRRIHRAFEALLLKKTPPDEPYSGEEVVHISRSIRFLFNWLRDTGLNASHGVHREVELSLAMHPGNKTVRDIELDEETHIYKELRPGEYAGTVDLILMPKDGLEIFIIDHKTGHYPDPDTSMQLMILGAMACLKFDRRKYVPGIFHCPKDGPDRMLLGTVTSAEEYLATLSYYLSDEHLTKYPQRNEHCRFCAARRWCPAWRSHASQR